MVTGMFVSVGERCGETQPPFLWSFTSFDAADHTASLSSPQLSSAARRCQLSKCVLTPTCVEGMPRLYLQISTPFYGHFAEWKLTPA
jgi:hypothetical protein